MILDGKKLNIEIGEKLQSEISGLEIKPRLCIVQVGNNEASNIYIGMKKAFADRIGAICDVHKLDDDVEMKEIISLIDNLNSDSNIHGIILQLPMPYHLNSREIINHIDYRKDVDGLSDISLGKLTSGNPVHVPATAKGILTLLKNNNVNVKGKSVTVVGRSTLVGKSTSLYLLNHDATVTICHSQTTDLKDELSNADIIISAVGHPGVIDSSMVNQNQIVVDVGITMVNGKIIGDVNVQDDDVAAISLVPGGVGPMTVASLFQNLLDAYHLVI